MLIIAVCAPYLFTLCDSILRSLFGKKPWPTLRVLALVLVVETAHSFGICLFTFRVLPKLDVARAILIMNAVCIIPGIFKLLLSKNDTSTFKKMLIFIIDLIAVLMQCTVFGIVFLSKFIFKNSGAVSNTGNAGGGGSLNDDTLVDAGGASLPDFTTTAPVASLDVTAGISEDFSDTAERMKRQLAKLVLNTTLSVLGNVTGNGSTIVSTGSSTAAMISTLVNSTATHLFRRRSLLTNDYDDLFETQQNGVASVINSDVGGGSPGLGGGIGMGDSGNKKVMLGGVDLEDIISSFQLEWELPIALLLVSLVWWENFIDRDLKFGKYKLVDVKLLKESLTVTRCKANFISSMWKVSESPF
jgi:hypothetical protein